jgi:hypothetical protein
MTGRNVLLALVLSLILSIIGTGIYIIYPLIMAILRNDEGVGIGATGGGLKAFFIIEPILFIIIFALLQWKHKKKLN